MMKKIIMPFFVAALSLLLLSGCRKDDPVNINSAETGSWHLVEWNGAVPESFDIYLELLSDGTFNLYQRLQTSDYEHLGGTFTLGGGFLNGIYDDGTTWTCRYSYSLNGTEDRLTLISDDAQAIKSIYERTDIPDDVRTGLFNN